MQEQALRVAYNDAESYFAYTNLNEEVSRKKDSQLVGPPNFVDFIFAIESFIVKFREFILALDRFERSQREDNYEIILLKGISSFIYTKLLSCT